MASIVFVLVNGTLADSNEVTTNFIEIYTNIDNTNIAAGAGIEVSKLETMTTGEFVVGTAANTAAVVTMQGDATVADDGTVTVASGGIVPTGTILAHYDFNGALGFGATYEYCDGSNVANAGSPVFGQPLPDLSGRYMVGFGVDGGGDIDTAPWVAGAVGNVGSVISFQHSHTVNAHTHDLSNHTHSMQAHTHTAGAHTHTLPASTGLVDQGGLHDFVTAASGVLTLAQTANEQGDHTHILGGSTGVGAGNTGAPSTANTGTPSNNNTSSSSPGTNNQLSAAQDIRPRSIQVRYIMRVI